MKERLRVKDRLTEGSSCHSVLREFGVRGLFISKFVTTAGETGKTKAKNSIIVFHMYYKSKFKWESVDKYNQDLLENKK